MFTDTDHSNTTNTAELDNQSFTNQFITSRSLISSSKTEIVFYFGRMRALSCRQEPMLCKRALGCLIHRPIFDVGHSGFLLRERFPFQAAISGHTSPVYTVTRSV
mgnify:CR=1 FL=1